MLQLAGGREEELPPKALTPGEGVEGPPTGRRGGVADRASRVRPRTRSLEPVRRRQRGGAPGVPKGDPLGKASVSLGCVSFLGLPS